MRNLGANGESQPEERKRDMSEEVSTRSSKRLEKEKNPEYKDESR